MSSPPSARAPSSGGRARSGGVWVRPRCGLALALALGLGLSATQTGCASKSTTIELRLFPCAFDGAEPQAVLVEIDGLDGDGVVLETHSVAFESIDAATFADGYATVGYNPGEGVSSAQVRLAWFPTPTAGSLADAEAVIDYGELALPGPGEVLSLDSEAEDCAQLVGDGTESEDEASETGTSGSESADTSTETSETSSESETSTETSDTSSESESADTSSESEDTSTGGDGPMPGDPCSLVGQYACVPAPDGQAGHALYCDNETEMLVEPTPGDFAALCSDDICPGPGASDGCGGIGAPAACLCPVGQSCDGPELGCGPDDTLFLCDGGDLYEAFCPGCAEEPGGTFSCQR